MAETDLEFAGSIPEIYDTYLVPMIFEAYATDLAKRVAALSPKAILETAAGSGVVARALAPRLAVDASYTATDLNQPMIDRAAYMQGPDSRITWRQSDAMALPFEDSTFDVVVCQFGVLFFPDKVSGYAEALRVLRPGGTFLFNVWDRIENNDFANTVTEAAAVVFPDNPPRFLARTPHGYYDVDLIEDELNRAGFSHVSVETIDEVSSAPSSRHPAIAYCHGTPLRNEIEALDRNLLDHVTDAATDAITARFGDGSISGKIRAHVFTTTRSVNFIVPIQTL